MPDEQIKVTYEDHMGNDLKVANAARVSYGKRSSMEEDEHGVWKLKDADKRLIQFLARGYTHEQYEDFISETLLAADMEDLEKAMWDFRDTGEHKSPFNHCFASFVVEAPLYVARQLV